MPIFNSLGSRPTALDIFSMNKEAARHIVEFHTIVLRGDGPLSEQQCEMIATYVSGLNGCEYCYGVHSAASVNYGTDRAKLDALFEDIDTAGVDPKMVPLLKYAGKLTRNMGEMSEADAQAVYDAGWGEDALHQAVLVTCIFNFMNRLLEGHGVKGNPAIFEARGKALVDQGYEPLMKALAD